MKKILSLSRIVETVSGEKVPVGATLGRGALWKKKSSAGDLAAITAEFRIKKPTK